MTVPRSTQARKALALTVTAAGVATFAVVLWLRPGDPRPAVDTVGHRLGLVVVAVVGAAAVLALAVVWTYRGRVVPPAWRRFTVAVLLLAASSPAGALLAALSRWWAASTPSSAAATWWAVASVAVGIAAWLTSRSAVPSPWRLAGWTAALVWLVMTVGRVADADLAAGSALPGQVGTYAAAALVLAAALGARQAGHPVRAVAAVAAVAAVTVAAAGASTLVASGLGVAFGLLAAGLAAPRVGGALRVDRWPVVGLGPLLAALVVAVVAALTDSVASAAGVVMVAGALLAASVADHAWGPLVDDPVPAAPPARHLPTVLVATGGGLLGVVLLTWFVVPPLPRPAGAATSGQGAPAVPADAPVVVLAVSGVSWDRVSPDASPTLWGLLVDGAPAGAVTPGATGLSRICPAAGWLAISSGANALAGVDDPGGGPSSCLPWETVALPDGGARVAGFDQLADLQVASEYRPRLGALGEALAPLDVCATAVGPRAALALAETDGSVARYRTLDAALVGGTDTFDCPITVVDAGSAVPSPDGGTVADALREVDQTVGRLLEVVPDEATVLVVDTGPEAPGRSRLGVSIGDAATGSGYLTSAATRWNGVYRLLDLPSTLLDRVGAPAQGFTGAPVTVGLDRPVDPADTVRELAELSERDQALRGTAQAVITRPLYAALAVLLFAAVGGPVLARCAPAWTGRARRVADVVLLPLAAVPVGVFAVTATSWWQADPSTETMRTALVATTVVVAGCAALVPRRPLTAGPGLLAGLTFGLLTLDAVLGTPLHRGSPFGPAVTLGGRYYGFGNPTYSLYVVAALVTATTLGGLLVRHGRRRLGAAAAGAVCGTAFVVDLWPGMGADVGGGLVLLPASAVVVLGVLGVRPTARRLLTAAAAGVAVVGAVGVLDWLRGPAARSHLGGFVQQVVDGSAWQIVSRKLDYAAATVTDGPAVWLTFALLLLVVGTLWPPRGWRSVAWDRLCSAWPLARTTVLALLVAGVGGALLNDYGVWVMTLMLTAAVPLFGLLLLRADDVPPAEPSWWRVARTVGRRVVR